MESVGTKARTKGGECAEEGHVCKNEMFGGVIEEGKDAFSGSSSPLAGCQDVVVTVWVRLLGLGAYGQLPAEPTTLKAGHTAL